MTRPLPRYVAAAALARLGDGGGTIALILLAASHGGTGAGVHEAAIQGAVLGACLTVPHLLGPFVARRVDLAAGARKPIASACLLYAAALAAAAATFGTVPFALSAVLVALAGTRGPLLTGGLSSRVPAPEVVAGSVAVLPVSALGAAVRFQLDSPAAAALAASCGVGYLLGAGIVLAFPLRGEPRRLMPVLAAALALGLAVTAASPGFAVSLGAYAAAGAVAVAALVVGFGRSPQHRHSIQLPRQPARRGPR